MRESRATGLDLSRERWQFMKNSFPSSYYLLPEVCKDIEGDSEYCPGDGLDGGLDIEERKLPSGGIHVLPHLLMTNHSTCKININEHHLH